MTNNDYKPRYPEGPGAAVWNSTTRQQLAGD